MEIKFSKGTSDASLKLRGVYDSTVATRRRDKKILDKKQRLRAALNDM